MRVPSLSPNAILEVELLCKIMVEPGSEPVFNSNVLYLGMLKISLKTSKKGPRFFDRAFQADSIPI